MKRVSFIIVTLFLPLFMLAQTAEECYQKAENYFYGKNGVDIDYSESLRWAKMATTLGHKDAQYRVNAIKNLAQGGIVKTVKCTIVIEVPSDKPYSEVVPQALIKAKNETIKNEFGIGYSSKTIIQNGINKTLEIPMGIWLGDTKEPTFIRSFKDGKELIEVTVKGKIQKIDFKESTPVLASVSNDATPNEDTNFKGKTVNVDEKYLQSLSKNMRNLVEKETNRLEKDGWKVRSNAPSLVQQIVESYEKQNEMDSDGYEKWITGESVCAGISYDACKVQANFLAQQEIASKISMDLQSHLDQFISDKGISDEEANNKAQTILKDNSKQIDKIVSHSISLIDLYRNTSKGTIEVMTRLAVSTDEISTLNINNQQKLMAAINEKIKKIQIVAEQKTTPSNPKVDKKIEEKTTATVTASQNENKETFAVIIGNENYLKVAKVAYARNDARTFAEFCRDKLNLPKDNIRLYEDATYGNMISAMADIKRIAKAYKGKINVIFYYAGHGIPDEETKDAFLMPIDVDGLSTEVCYPLAKLYKELDDLKANSVTAFMDACFSGSERGNGMVVAARGVALKVKNDAPKGNTVVFTAATDKQTAYPYEEKKHGMFTYYLLEKLRETNGNCTLGELSNYVIEEVNKRAVVANGKEQTPVVLTSMGANGEWRNHKLK